MAPVQQQLFDRLERFYDALPRDMSHTEEFGGLVLFVRDGAGWPFYARPRPGAVAPASAADITAVRRRQRDLGLPESFEWIHDTHPDLLAVAGSAGLAVLEAPLMVLDPAALPAPDELPAVPVRFLDPDDPRFETDISTRRALAVVGFGAPGTAPGPAGAATRDATIRALPAEPLAEERVQARAGRRVSALAETPGAGPIGCGTAMRVDDLAELTGVATPPAARRRGVATALTAALARRMLELGTGLVFLSAGSEEIARVYLRVGFRRIGTACIAEPAAVGAP